MELPSTSRSSDHGFVNETKTLLAKSLSHNSLTSNDLEVQIQSLRKKPSSGRQRHGWLWPPFLCALAIVLVLVVVSRGTWREPPTTDEALEEHLVKELLATGEPFPYSRLDPVRDLNVAPHGRPKEDPSFPSYYYGDYYDSIPHRALPTNAWYQNLLQAPSNGAEPTNLQRVYPGPYLLDVVGTIPGLRLHATDIDASTMVMQLSFNERFGLVLGAAEAVPKDGATSGGSSSNRYRVAETTDLGITLEWEAMSMKSNIVKGMAFVTMEYEKNTNRGGNEDVNFLLPTIAALPRVDNTIVVDGVETVWDPSRDFRVEKDMELYFRESDYTWMVFFSEPVRIRPIVDDGKTLLQVVGYDKSSRSDTLAVRVALLDQCTNGWNPVSCRRGLGNRLPDEPNREEYKALLRAHVDTFPGPKTSFSYVMPERDGDNRAELIFDWDVRRMSDLSSNRTSPPRSKADDAEFLAFAIPHQMDRLPSYALPNNKRYCKTSLTGPACLVRGAKWTIPQELPEIGFRAKRPPRPEFIPTLAEALSKDIGFKIPDYFKRGSGDTYFSGKLLAKLARILLVSEEVESLCGAHVGRDYLEYCQSSSLPNQTQIEEAVRELREGVEVWINGSADTPMVYDTSWGGIVSCGCWFDGTKCTNQYPNCPGFEDPGLNFGNGFYNDHHFHYGYHIFAAAVVAHYDPVWGMDNFDNVLMLVRDIANPSDVDIYFPTFRHKDWYQGSSWASGIAYPAYLNGNNQESSSEAISAYEGVALFGQVMNKIWQEDDQIPYAAVSKQIANVGRLMAGTELVSAKRYWHIPDEKYQKYGGTARIYPEQYEQNVVGILWQTMAQFGTWFGAAPYLPIGIQLLPLTPISEERDEIEWVNSIYEPLTDSCATNFQCTESGWSILQVATLATVGYAHEAALKVQELPDDAFENAGGNGHSRSNTIWYISTRPEVENPIPMGRYDKRGKEEVRPKAQYELKDCYLPGICTDEVLNQYAGGFTCRDRISWMIHSEDMPQYEACWRVAGLEFPDICGPCNPEAAVKDSEEEQEPKEEIEPKDIPNTLQCRPCTQEECNSDLNRCPVYKHTFVCTGGTSKGACSGNYEIWLEDNQCDECCEMTDCFGLKDHEAKKFTKDGNALTKQTSCPPCKPEICYGKLNQCPSHTAPYVCMGGLNIGGCASAPWNINDLECTECCEIKLDC